MGKGYLGIPVGGSTSGGSDERRSGVYGKR